MVEGPYVIRNGAKGLLHGLQRPHIPSLQTNLGPSSDILPPISHRVTRTEAAMPAQVELKPVNRDDVARLAVWLADPAVAEAWFGRYTYGDPVHLGYDPKKMLHASQAEWDVVFGKTHHSQSQPHHEHHRDIFSVYSKSGEHIGEGHLAIDAPMGDAHLSVLIGNKDLWHHGYGTAATLALLEHAFDHLDLHRVWVDVPTYNPAARNMFEHLGFKHEGTLRKSRPHAGARHDSFVMGILKDEFHHIYPDGVSSHVVTWDAPKV